MKKIYQAPLTDCTNGCQSFSIMAGSLKSDGEGNWTQDTSTEEKGDEEGEGRSNQQNIWDTL